MKEKMSDDQSTFIKRHKWPMLVMILVIVVSYFTVSTKYQYVLGDAGAIARSMKIFHEQGRVVTGHMAPVLLGQLLFTEIICQIFGYSLKALHITVFIVNLLSLFAMYLILMELDIERFLALFGALTLLINPVSIQIIDSYLTEPFFMMYLLFALLFFIKGVRRENTLHLYLGGICAVFAVMTRQYAVSLSMAVILLCIIYRKRCKKGVVVHAITASLLPIAAIGLYYLYLFLQKRLHGPIPTAYASAETSILYNFAHPLNLLSTLYFDSLFFLHYAALYTAPLLIILFFSIIRRPKKIYQLGSSLPFSIISLSYVSAGTLILWIIYNELMPYLPNIFSISILTTLFSVPIMGAETSARILTLFTWIGAVVVLIKMLEQLCASNLFYRVKKGGTGKKDIAKEDPADATLHTDLGARLLYFWGIIYIILSSILVLRYDRYILPISILVIYLILSQFPFIKELKKITIVIFVLTFTIFICRIAGERLGAEVLWEADYFLLNQEGIPANRINGTLGFNHLYNYEYITDLYKDTELMQKLNLYKFHPLADFFVQGAPVLDKTQPGLTLYKTFAQKRFFGLLERKSYIYKRKEGYIQAIWFK